MTDEQQQETPRWTSDHLQTEQGVALYADQIRAIFRDYARDFRALADEVRRDAQAAPVEGDNAVTSWLHARQLARGLRQMARHSELIVKAGKQLETDHRRVRVQLPAARRQKAAARAAKKRAALAARQQGALGAGGGGVEGTGVGRAVEHVAGTDTGQGQERVDQQPATPFGALFGTGGGR
ncbi:hypothetical protein SAMN06297387_12849 [Streptomyces zhaozhouensis]|uniref:Uncharacterized protein n=1 Tax=Streptomyces zhaozhouensis TaxID=1300267 RepID=A0A286E847_9ACTN|nr:hypothetical protein [Streptomyces zhaozhouensis]SOD67061.1 hypothetical protein SAMN06297387_12849 [Streptomyces zhaozhouensis]